MRTRTVASIIISTTLRIAAGCRIDTSSFHCVTHQDLRGIARQIRKTTITACNVVILQIPTVTVAYIIRISYYSLFSSSRLYYTTTSGTRGSPSDGCSIIRETSYESQM